MNPEIKARWIAALRSGNYKQGKFCLNKGDEFCCLGVLCEVLSNELHLDKQFAYGTNSMRRMYNGQQTRLPDKVVDYCGLTFSDPYLGEHSCITCNDTLNMDFEQIADRIEGYL